MEIFYMLMVVVVIQLYVKTNVNNHKTLLNFAVTHTAVNLT